MARLKLSSSARRYIKTQNSGEGSNAGKGGQKENTTTTTTTSSYGGDGGTVGSLKDRVGGEIFIQKICGHSDHNIDLMAHNQPTN